MYALSQNYMKQQLQNPCLTPPFKLLPNGQPFPYFAMGTGKLQDQQTLTALIRKGLSLGICKHIDTGRIYNNEKQLGNAIKTVINEDLCKRQDLFIATKLHNCVHLDPVTQLEEALKAMQLEYVDLFYVHWPFLDMDQSGNMFTHKSLEQCWAGFQECVRKGYARHLGLSNFNGQMISQLLTFCKIKPIALQIQLNPYNPQPQLVKLSKSLKIHIMAYSPLGKGQTYINKQYNLFKQPIILQISKKYNKKPSQIVLRYTLQRGIGVIPKTANLERLVENYQCLAVDLGEQDKRKIGEIGENKGNRIFKGVFKYICAFDF